MKKVDFIVAFVVMIIAFAGMGAMRTGGESSSQKHAEIWTEGQLYRRVDIKEGYSEKIKIENEHGYNVVYVHDRGVEVTEADCKDGICVDMGFIENDGQIIACLPHKLYVKIVSDIENNEVDAISQ
ncbi:NusG domain II-containing protein [Peptoclostridium litorale]|uniref:NusG domain II-containing protein n=1 Tax=Peptoclostridium litorale TaxID=1557 RepID=UPI00056DB3D2|nr:NusG domain II-containing protein [Peptoclostridium litorale]